MSKLTDKELTGNHFGNHLIISVIFQAAYFKKTKLKSLAALLCHIRWLNKYLVGQNKHLKPPWDLGNGFLHFSVFSNIFQTNCQIS